ncbi:MAG: CRISPR-associated protein Cas4 [Candidatus Heimdallarchaeota archaeon]|nr:CRISPR-associated protein Cas4 [Candidatus Heimdallarchaeota archaeon]
MSEVMFSAEEFRQYVYCPRIIFFRHVAKIIPEQTYKMKLGTKYHDDKVRRNTQSIQDNLIIDYNIYLEDQTLGICALFDAIAREGEKKYFPIEFKTGKTPCIIPEHHFAQLVAQAMLIEHYYQTIVSQVEIRYGGDKRFLVSITDQDKSSLLAQLKTMREMVTNEDFPPPTKFAAKCHDCEFWIPCRRA